MKMDDVTVGITSFYRPDNIEMCLESLKELGIEFEEIIIADNGGKRQEKKEIYDKYQNDLPLKVIHLDYDYGLAASRNKILEEMKGEFYLLIDDDMLVPENVVKLKQTLLNNPDLGGISGVLLEEGDLRAYAHDIFLAQCPFRKKVLVRDVKSVRKKEVQVGDKEEYYYQFDFIPNCALFRKECLEDISWDGRYTIAREHIDFYLNHKLNSQWDFGLRKDVAFPHYPGGSIDFEENRNSSKKLAESKSYFLDKWDLEEVIWVDRFMYRDEGFSRSLKRFIKSGIPKCSLNNLKSFYALFKRLRS